MNDYHTGPNILGLLPEEVEALIPSGFRTPFRARQLMAWIYRHGLTRFEEMTNLPKVFRTHAAENYTVGTMEMLAERVSTTGDATKYLWQLEDNERTESVYLVLPTRETFCISSQVGCAYGCSFCATATMGFKRHLTSTEIIEQVFRMREALRAASALPPSFNLVFMGMGEPLANYDAVVDAIRRLVHPEGMGLGEKRITVSTVGLAPEIRRLAEERFRVGLAISLNATTDEQRSRLMPVTRKHSIADVMDAALAYVEQTGRRVTLEYVLMAGINDSQDDADRLARIARGLPCKINLIPFNPFPGSRIDRPDEETLRLFAERLMPQAPAVTLRSSRGLDIAAACGQLALMT